VVTWGRRVITGREDEWPGLVLRWPAMVDAEELQKKLRTLEKGQVELKREVSRLMSTERALCQNLIATPPAPQPGGVQEGASALEAGERGSG
jgi:hypothetical protein